MTLLLLFFVLSDNIKSLWLGNCCLEDEVAVNTCSLRSGSHRSIDVSELTDRRKLSDLCLLKRRETAGIALL